MLTVPDPPLTDGRVALRRWCPDDLDAVVAACADRSIARWTTVPWPYTEDDGRAFLERVADDWRTGRAASFAIVERAEGPHTAGTDRAGLDGAPVVGAIDVRLAPGAHPGSGEGGYWVAPWARGRGIAVAALRLVTAWSFRSLGLRVVTLQIVEGNAPSVRVAERAGFHRAGRVDADIDGVHHATLLFARLAPRG